MKTTLNLLTYDKITGRDNKIERIPTPQTKIFFQPIEFRKHQKLQRQN